MINASNNQSSRRQFLGSLGLGGAALLAAPALTAQAADKKTTKRFTKDPFSYCLNTSTIRGQKKSLVEEINMISKAGYNGIEPWMNEIGQYQKEGGSLTDLRKRIADAGLRVESAIGFANWIVDDEARRKKGLEDAKRDMDLVAAIGGTRIAAPPVGATRPGQELDLDVIAKRYHDLLDVGRKAGVVPMLEVWGFSTNLHRLGQTCYVITEAEHPDACGLLDVYHIYKGGSKHHGMRALSPSAFPVLHMNDYPGIPIDEINDSDRVYPGDGIAPLDMILSDMANNQSTAVLSLELFNRDYWKQDAEQVVKTGLQKMKAATVKALNL